MKMFFFDQRRWTSCNTQHNRGNISCCSVHTELPPPWKQTQCACFNMKCLVRRSVCRRWIQQIPHAWWTRRRLKSPTLPSFAWIVPHRVCAKTHNTAYQHLLCPDRRLPDEWCDIQPRVHPTLRANLLLYYFFIKTASSTFLCSSAAISPPTWTAILGTDVKMFIIWDL